MQEPAILGMAIPFALALLPLREISAKRVRFFFFLFFFVSKFIANLFQPLFLFLLLLESK